MFKFTITYKNVEGYEDRTATVFAENLDEAVDIIRAADEEYRDIVTMEFKEKPHWNGKK